MLEILYPIYNEYCVFLSSKVCKSARGIHGLLLHNGNIKQTLICLMIVLELFEMLFFFQPRSRRAILHVRHRTPRCICSLSCKLAIECYVCVQIYDRASRESIIWTAIRGWDFWNDATRDDEFCPPRPLLFVCIACITLRFLRRSHRRELHSRGAMKSQAGG